MEPDLHEIISNFFDSQSEIVSSDSPSANTEISFSSRKRPIFQYREAEIVPLNLIFDKEPFHCPSDTCSKTFRNAQSMKLHARTHGLSDFQINSWAAKENMRVMGSRGKRIDGTKVFSQCPLCSGTFVGIYELRRHFLRQHRCKTCNGFQILEV